jgi:hydroxymethylglutaryl-CoA lyase
VDLDALLEAAELAQRLVGGQLPSNVLRAGPRMRLTPLDADVCG